MLILVTAAAARVAHFAGNCLLGLRADVIPAFHGHGPYNGKSGKLGAFFPTLYANPPA